MQIWTTVLHALQLLTAFTMIGLVLIQHGKGADMGASFGSGASGSLFGASGSANFLSRSTAACAAVFFACTLALAFSSNAGRGESTLGAGSVLDRASSAASAPAPAAVIPAAAPAASVPAGVPAAIPAPIAAPASEPASAPK